MVPSDWPTPALKLCDEKICAGLEGFGRLGIVGNILRHYTPDEEAAAVVL
jgi:hypothetical protein